MLAEDWVVVRFIPTCVGNTDLLAVVSPAIAVHPHVRGEHQSFGKSRHGAIGSSPRAWGTLRRQVDVADDDRFIPTCVGNTG